MPAVAASAVSTSKSAPITDDELEEEQVDDKSPIRLIVCRRKEDIRKIRRNKKRERNRKEKYKKYRWTYHR
jgi:hypothetical protein